MTDQTDRPIEEQVGAALRLVAATAVLDREPPPLTAERADEVAVVPASRSHARTVRVLAVAAAVAVVVAGVVAVEGVRGERSSELAIAPAETTSTVSASTAATADGPPVLLTALPELDGRAHELWAYHESDGTPCAVQAFVEAGERMIEGNDCGLTDVCMSAEWAALSVDGVPLRGYGMACDPSARSFSSFGAVLGDPAVDPTPDSGVFGALRFGSQATPTGNDGYDVAPIGTLWGRLDPDVASWEIDYAGGDSIGPLPVIRHPQDPSTSYLFSLGRSPWSGAEVILRDADGVVLSTAVYPGPGLPAD